MKTRLNLTIEASLLSQIKLYAAQKHVSVSELVEQYFKRLAKPPQKSNLIELVKLIESLPKPEIDFDFKKQYYEERASKYGF